jgi:hypothetical protein
VNSHSQQPRNPTDNSVCFPNSHTCHDPRSNWQPSLPRWLRGPPTSSPLRSLSLSPRDIAFSDDLNGFPRRSRWWIHQIGPYSRERADNVVGVSAPVALRLPPVRRMATTHNTQHTNKHYVFLLAHLTFDRACEPQQSSGLSPSAPPPRGGGGSGRSSAIPARPPGTAPGGQGTVRFSS